MARNMYCKKCGEKYPPLDREDVAVGWQDRRVWQAVQKPMVHFIVMSGKRIDLKHLVCDGCGETIADGNMALLVTTFRNNQAVAAWEHEFAVKHKP